MTITYPLAFPTTLGPSAIEIGAKNVIVTSMSPFSLVQQVVAHPGQQWTAMVSLPPMNRADAEVWIGWLLSLVGPSGTFTMGDPLGATPQGAATETTVLVNGASQTGATLAVDGAANSVTAWLKAGDYIQLGSGSTARLHKVLQNANTNGSGQATLDIWPSLRSSPADNATVTIRSAVGRWRLASSEQRWSIHDAATYGITFAAVEAL